MINKLRKNYKFIIGLILGLIFSISVVQALYRGRADEVSYDSSGTWLHSTNVQDALDELYEQKENRCPVNNICLQKKNTLALGDYVSYTPGKTSYTTDTSKTGYTSTQTINPSELNLWRVISIKSNGTVEIISENVSSTKLYFRGRTGYQNLVGYLNVIASQYETSGITVGSRYFGYNGQTQYITDTSKFTSTAPWTCSTGDSGCNPVESKGGGDTLYLNDYNLVNTVLGTRFATDPSGSYVDYYMASRRYGYSSATSYNWSARFVGTSTVEFFPLYMGSSFSNSASMAALRPIITLSSSLSYYGVGNKEYPMEIVS